MRGINLLESAKELFEKEALLLPGLYVDPEVFELEKERIFARSWVFLAHESEIPRPGDYVMRYGGDNA
jgi:PAH dioxygenase large subunit